MAVAESAVLVPNNDNYVYDFASLSSRLHKTLVLALEVF